jgi:hypothetical protein
MNSLIEVTQTVLLIPARLLAQVEYSTLLSSGTGARPLFWIFWTGVHGLNDRSDVERSSPKPASRMGRIIPIYNWYILCKIVGRPGWWVILLLIPFVNFIVGIVLCIDLAKSFGKGVGFGIGLVLLSVIFFPILGFGSAQYQGPTAGSLPPRTAPQAA